MHNKKLFAFIVCAVVASHVSAQNNLFQFDNNQSSTRWSSPENSKATKGGAGTENYGAKGHAFDTIAAGGSKTLLDVQGTGIVNRIWITIDDRQPLMLRSLVLEMYWDGESKPAVSVPFGDFFSVGLGRTATFQNALFASPEGRSFECFIPMPFKKGARIVVVNQSAKTLTHIFFDVDFEYLQTWKDDNLYFHAYWHRDTATTLAKDFELLPSVTGKGRFLGSNIGVNANPIYGDAWWGEGEVKMYMDSDTQTPTIAGTGTEDYIGTGWGQGQFINNYSGCLVADGKQKQWAYYRYHVPDPVFFHEACRVALQQIGGNSKSKVTALQNAGVPLIPVTMDNNGRFTLLYKPGSLTQLQGAALADGWVNFYRSDDVSATAYFYLNTPADNLPALQPLAVRTYNLKNQ